MSAGSDAGGFPHSALSPLLAYQVNSLDRYQVMMKKIPLGLQGDRYQKTIFMERKSNYLSYQLRIGRRVRRGDASITIPEESANCF